MSSAVATIPSTGRPVRGSVRLPGSKSITNRALLIAGLADGETVIDGALMSDDTTYLAESLRRLGVPVEEQAAAERFVVAGTGGRFPAKSADLFTGNAGTATRFLVAALCLGQGTYRIDGVPRMRQRPIGPLLSGLRQAGANVRSEFDNDCPPVVVEAAGLPGGTVRVRGDISSQYFSALMMAGPLTERGLTIDVEGELVSRPYVDLTAAVMAAFGATSEVQEYRRIVVPGGQRYLGRRYAVEPDASTASYFFAAAAITGGKIRVEGLTGNSAQGDVHFVDVLEQMGCRVERGTDFVEVEGPAQLRGVRANFGDISDTAMTLAAIAPFADGPVEINGVAFIRAKETDRVDAITRELRRVGVEVEELDDGWRIQPGTPRAAAIETYDDHRIAMSFAVMALRTPGLEILNPGCVSKTFPDFFERFEALLQQ